MKRKSLFAFLMAAPLAALSQQVIFTDNFTSGSTTNKTSTPGGSATASFTSYDLAASKSCTNSAASGHLKIGLSAPTGAGFWEAQAVFTGTPVVLATVGDNINLTYTFTNTGGNLFAGGTSSFLCNGLYNSGGTVPVALSLASSGLNNTSGSAYASGNCQGWVGYVSRIANGGTSSAYTRPAQNPSTGTVSANQDLIGNNWGGGSYTNLSGITFDALETASFSLPADSPYTVSYTIALTAAGTLSVTNSLFSGTSATGTPVFSQTNTLSGSTNITQSFDSLCIGVRNGGTSFNPIIDLAKIVITKNIYGSPGPSFNVTGGGTNCVGSTAVVGLSGSVSTNSYYLLTNGVPNGSVIIGTGSAISFPAETIVSVTLTNTVLASNTVSGFTGLMSGGTLASPVTAPVITTQPVAVTVATNNIGVFVVMASGNSIGYQWYKNGVKLSDSGHFAGSGTATLVISPATTADATTGTQGYYCAVTNSCGATTYTLTNNLVLDAGTNIVWQGGNPNNVWDLAATANFTNSIGAVVKFNSGDKVTLDDSSAYPVISVSGSYVTPNSITENASQNYFITATSSPISGPGSLTMSGSGTLTVSNANAFTGGTTINNGTVKINNYGALGTNGTISLAGGTLELGISGNSTQGVTNNINTTANSKLQYDQSGTYAGVIFGALTGNAGTSLNIFNYNANTVTSRLRLYGIFTNDCNLLISSLGASVDLSIYNGTNGNQVFNGVISGTAGRILARNTQSGTVIFNNTNTFNDSGISGSSGYSLVMSQGSVGFGADSVSSSPPTIDASPAGTGIIAINSAGSESGDCTLFASGGAHNVGNPILFTSTTNTMVLNITGSNALTLSGNIQLALSGDVNGTNRILNIASGASAILSGVISDNSHASGIVKKGSGPLYLNGVNTYSGDTVNMAGLLAGSGTIAGNVFVTNGASLGGGGTSIGTLAISGNLTNAGNLYIRVNKALAPQSNDVITVAGSLLNTGTGTVTVTNLGVAAIAVGDKFKLFSSALTGGNTMTVTGGGMTWANNLAVDGSIQATGAAFTTASYSTNISYSVTGGGTTLTVSWPATHLGWELMVQTNTLANGLGNNWVTNYGTASVTSTNLPINPNNGAVFYKLVHP
jgi:fibronectin-binding autotransporter adhesin